MSLFQKEKAQALLELLQCHFSEDYNGTDDDMETRFDSWVSGLSDKEVSDIVLKIFREGI